MTRIAYVLQKGRTGARAQAEVLAEHFEDVQLVFGNPLGVESPDAPYIIENGVLYPTADLARAIAAYGPDVVVIHIFNQGTAESLPAISTFAPTVLRAGINPTESMLSGGAQARQYGHVIRMTQTFDHIVAPAPAVARDLECLGVEPDRVTVIPTGLTMDQLEPPDVNAPQHVGCLAGRISPLKNQHTLVFAMGGLRELDPTLPANLYLTGGADQAYQQTVTNLANAIGVGNRVQYTGFVDPETGYFPRVGVNCLPSFSERMPQAVLEAARAGVPSVVADAAWAESFDSMVTAPADDPMAWAETLAELLNNDARRVQVAQAQQEEVYARFQAADVAGRYEALFEELVASTAPFKLDPGVLA